MVTVEKILYGRSSNRVHLAVLKKPSFKDAKCESQVVNLVEGHQLLLGDGHLRVDPLVFRLNVLQVHLVPRNDQLFEACCSF